MKIRDSIVLMISLTASLAACAEGETINTPTNGTGGAIVGGSGGGPAGTGGATAGTGGGTAGGTGECALGTSDTVCNDCINGKCFASCEACSNNQACLDLLTCLQGCADTTCEDNCMGQYPAGEQPLMAFIGSADGCLTLQCDAECGSTGCGLTTSDAVCDDCINSKCFNECSACANNPSCLDLLTCIQDCADGDAACQDNCANVYSSGVDALLNFLGTDGCMSANCSVECG